MSADRPPTSPYEHLRTTIGQLFHNIAVAGRARVSMKYIFIGIFIMTFVLTCDSGALSPDNASLSGRVTDSDGDGVIAQVKIYKIVVKDGRSYLQSKCAVVSNQEGQYSCSAIPAGKYLVRENPVTSKAKDGQTSVEVIPASFYPGVFDLAEAETVSVASGGTGWADIRIPAVREVTVSGKLIPGAPEAAFTLKDISDNVSVDTGVPIHYDGSTGEFEVRGLSPGHYSLEADWLVNDSEHRASVLLDISGTSVKNLILTPLPMVEISGHIRPSAENIRISELHLSRTDGSIPALTSPVKKGDFHFPAAPAGEYRVELGAGSNSYISSLFIDGKETDGSQFLTGDTSSQIVAVSVCEPAFNINGNVSSWNTDATAADIIAVSVSDGTLYHTLTDAQHHFSIRGLPPGSYRLFAFPGPDLIPFRDVRILKKYKDDSAEVSVEQAELSAATTLSLIEISP